MNSTKITKLAILFTGLIRGRKEYLTELTSNVQNKGESDGLITDIYISTYNHHMNIALQFTPEDRIIANNISEIPKLQVNEYQWYHLDLLLKKFALHRYDIILKLRFDMKVSKKLQANMFDHVRCNTIYAASDQSFYSRSNEFIATFFDYYDFHFKLINRPNTYFPLNYSNILMSNSRALSFGINNVRTGIGCTNQLVFPCNIYSSNPQMLKINIKKMYPAVSKEVCNVNRGNTYFASEKYFALNVLNNYPVDIFRLPIHELFADRHEHEDLYSGIWKGKMRKTAPFGK